MITGPLTFTTNNINPQCLPIELPENTVIANLKCRLGEAIVKTKYKPEIIFDEDGIKYNDNGKPISGETFNDYTMFPKTLCDIIHGYEGIETDSAFIDPDFATWRDDRRIYVKNEPIAIIRIKRNGEETVKEYPPKAELEPVMLLSIMLSTLKSKEG